MKISVLMLVIGNTKSKRQGLLHFISFLSFKEEKGLSAEEVEELAVKHTQELQEIQLQYEKKLEALSYTLARVRADRDRDIKALEQGAFPAIIHSSSYLAISLTLLFSLPLCLLLALAESEAGKGKRTHGPSDIR